MRKMNGQKRTIITICCSLAVAMTLAMAAFALRPDVAEAKKVTNKTITLKVGQKYQLTAMGIGSKIKWTSSKKKVATVSKGGLVKAKKAGITKITAKGTRGKVSCKIKVKAKKKTTKKTKATAKPAGTTAQSTVANSEYIKNISAATSVLDDGKIICTVQNNNSVTMKGIHVELTLYNSAGTAVGTDKIDYYNVSGNGGTRYSKVLYEDRNLGFDPSKTNAVITLIDYPSSREYSDPNGYLSAKYDPDAKKTTLTFNNTTANKLYIEGFYEFRDENNKLLAITWIYEIIEAGNPSYVTIDDPKKTDGGSIPYAKTTFVGNAYIETGK